MKTKNVLAIGTGILSLGFAIPSAHADGKKPDAKKPEVKKEVGRKPDSSPGWIVIEDDFWYPWIYEPIDWFHNSEVHFRQKEEKAAASEIRKSITWLKFAASHAMPITKEKLDAASALLTKIAGDLSNGKTYPAKELSGAIAQASHALAEWHYFAAEDSFAKSEEKDAAIHLQAAATYLKHAADSAQYQYGDEFETVYQTWYGWDVVDAVPNSLSQNLNTVKTELDKLATTLKDDAKKE